MKKISRPRQLFLYIAPFPPLALFKIWAASAPAPGNLLIAACLMLAYCITIIIIAFRWDKPTYFDWAVGAYFALVSGLLYALPGTAGPFFHNYAVTGIYSILFAASFLPPLLGFEILRYAQDDTLT